ncbi:MAG: hypothetical protein ACI9ZT_002113 [Gammaproteobacteria bacterium]|jgi:hypothetical protein
MKREKVIRICIINIQAIFILLLGPTQLINAQIPDVLINWPDIIYINGVIVTMDDSRINDNPGSIVQAMAVRDEKIIALGTSEEIQKMKGPETEVVNLQGNQVLPGLIDSHKHIMWGAEARATNIFNLTQTVVGYRLELLVERTPEEMLAKVEAAIKQLRARVDVGIDDWIDISLITDTNKGYPSISTVSNMMDTRDPADSEITQEDLNNIVSDRMFQLDSGGGIFSNSGDFDIGTWVNISAGPDGAAEFKALFKVDEWVEWDYSSRGQ